MDTTSIQTIDCEPDSMKDNHSIDSLEAGKENPAFVIDEYEYNAEPVEEVKTIKVNGYQEEVPDESEERQQWSTVLFLGLEGRVLRNLYDKSIKSIKKYFKCVSYINIITKKVFGDTCRSQELSS